jgi:DNA-binding transcriptional ArsR family regulator
VSASAAVDATHAALADPVRRGVVDLLADGPRRAGELADALEVAPSVMSRHLRVLREGALVEESHPPFDARVRVYSLRVGAMDGLKQWLDQVEQGWSDQLGAFARHVERKQRER